MLILTAAQNTQPDYVALAMVLALAFIVVILAIRKRISKNKKNLVEIVPISEETAPMPVAPGSAGEVKLHGVEPKTAAMLMAIVANKMERPLNELRFISIKEVE